MMTCLGQGRKAVTAGESFLEVRSEATVLSSSEMGYVPSTALCCGLSSSVGTVIVPTDNLSHDVEHHLYVQ